MNICHVVTCFKAGGAQTFLASLSIAQKKTSNNVFLISIDHIEKNEFNNSLLNKLDSNGINIFSFNRVPGKNLTIINSFREAIKFFQKNKFDIVNTHLPLSHLFISSIPLKLTIVNTIHNAPEKTSLLTTYINRSKPKIYCSQSARDLNKFNGKCTVINNGIEFTKPTNHSKIDIYEELKIPVNSKLVISVGALRPQKNYVFLTNLIKEHFEGSNIHFLICGNIVTESNVSNQILDCNLENLHYLGVKSNINDYLNSSDLFLSCSLFEGLPIAVLEAVFQGLPCVLSPIKPHKEIFEGLEGIYIPSKLESKFFKTEILNHFNSSEVVLKLNNSRQAFIESYRIENTSLEYINFYNKVKNEK